MTDPEGYGLVMPFVASSDQGGSFDGSGFVAGFECGSINAFLAAARPWGVTVERYIDPRLIPQLDLIAMKHGYKMLTEPWDEHPDEWAFATFTPATEDDAGG